MHRNIEYTILVIQTHRISLFVFIRLECDCLLVIFYVQLYISVHNSSYSLLFVRGYYNTDNLYICV